VHVQEVVKKQFVRITRLFLLVTVTENGAKKGLLRSLGFHGLFGEKKEKKNGRRWSSTGILDAREGYHFTEVSLWCRFHKNALK